jgi:hypothetical protein
MRERHEIEILLKAMQPIVHLAGNEGNIGIIKRRKVQRDDGSFTHVPEVSGDSLRHALRERGTYALLQAADLLGPHLTEAALRLLFAGGMVSGAASAVKLEEWRELCDCLPHLGLLGGCVGNRVREGSLSSDSALLVCEESMALLPEWVEGWLAEKGRAVCGARSHIGTSQRTRMDPTLRPDGQRLLSDGERARVEQRLLASENASAMDDDRAKLATKSSMMPFEYQHVLSGSLWYWRVTCVTHSEVERDALAVMLQAFLDDPYAGGKRNTGNGRLRMVHYQGFTRAQRVEPEALTVDGITSPEVARFRAHVHSRRDRIKEILESVVA